MCICNCLDGIDGEKSNHRNMQLIFTWYIYYTYGQWVNIHTDTDTHITQFNSYTYNYIVLRKNRNIMLTCCVNFLVKNGIRYFTSNLIKPFRFGRT